MILALKHSAPLLYNAPIVCSCTQLANNEETRQLVMLLNTHPRLGDCYILVNITLRPLL